MCARAPCARALQTRHSGSFGLAAGAGCGPAASPLRSPRLWTRLPAWAPSITRRGRARGLARPPRKRFVATARGPGPGPAGRLRAVGTASESCAPCLSSPPCGRPSPWPSRFPLLALGHGPATMTRTSASGPHPAPPAQRAVSSILATRDRARLRFRPGPGAAEAWMGGWPSGCLDAYARLHSPSRRAQTGAGWAVTVSESDGPGWVVGWVGGRAGPATGLSCRTVGRSPHGPTRIPSWPCRGGGGGAAAGHARRPQRYTQHGRRPARPPHGPTAPGPTLAMLRDALRPRQGRVPDSGTAAAGSAPGERGPRAGRAGC